MTTSDAEVQAKPPVGTPVRFMDERGEDTLAIVTGHPGVAPAMVAVTTERRGYVALLTPADLRPTRPEDALDVHWLQAHIMLTHNPRRTP